MSSIKDIHSLFFRRLEKEFSNFWTSWPDLLISRFLPTFSSVQDFVISIIILRTRFCGGLCLIILINYLLMIEWFVMVASESYWMTGKWVICCFLYPRLVQYAAEATGGNLFMTLLHECTGTRRNTLRLQKDHPRMVTKSGCFVAASSFFPLFLTN